MYIIHNITEVLRLRANGTVSQEMALYLERQFTIRNCGPISILEAGDQELNLPGLPMDLALLMPEWVSQLKFNEETYFVAYFPREGAATIRCLFPQSIASQIILTWLKAQPLEEETVEKRNSI